MILHVIRKELLVNLLSLRFQAGFLVSVVMMGLVGYVLVEEYAARQQTYLSSVQEHQKALANNKVYSTVEAIVDIPPSPLSAFSRGTIELPTSVRVSPYHIPSLIDEEGTGTAINLSGSSDRPTNPLLKMFASIDLSFVISTILSLFAVLLVFDSFSGEREQGTLKLLLSSSTGRVHLLVGKYLGALITLAIPLTVGFLEVLILWIFHARLSLEPSVWAGMGVIYLVSLIFLAGFLSFALFLSLFARESSSCLMNLLLAWVTFVILIPEGGKAAADYFRPNGLRQKILTDVENAQTDFLNAYTGMNYQQKGGWNNVSTNPFEGESFLGITEDEARNRMEFNRKIVPQKFQFAENRYRIVESYGEALTSWATIRDNITRPSLCVQFTNAVEAIAGTDLQTFGQTVGRARIYRDAVMSFLQQKVDSPEWFTRVFEYPDVQPTDENMRYWQKLIDTKGERSVERILSWDRIAPVNLSGLPPPRIEVTGLPERFGHALFDIMLLLVTTSAFLVLSIVRIVRYAVQ